MRTDTTSSDTRRRGPGKGLFLVGGLLLAKAAARRRFAAMHGEEDHHGFRGHHGPHGPHGRRGRCGEHQRDTSVTDDVVTTDRDDVTDDVVTA